MYGIDELMKMNVLGYTYKIYNSGYNTEMINKQCNAGHQRSEKSLVCI